MVTFDLTLVPDLMCAQEQHNHIAEASNTHAFSSDNKPPPALAAAAPLVTETEPKEEDPLFLASLLKKSAEEVCVCVCKMRSVHFSECMSVWIILKEMGREREGVGEGERE